MGKNNLESYLLWEYDTTNTIRFDLDYIDAAGDLMAGILLGQIHKLQGQSGVQPMLRYCIVRYGFVWIAKTREDWYDEIRMSPKQFDRAINILVQKGLAQKQIFQLDGSPTVHVRTTEGYPPIPDLIKRRKKPGFVYVMQAGPYSKIGVASDIKRRMRQIGTLPPFDIEIVCTFKTDNALGIEADLHRQFADKRIKGEWFILDQADIDYLVGLAGER